MVLRASATALLLALLAPATTQAATLFCCQDPANGRRVCADSLPDQCRGRPYRVLDGAGNVVREVEGALTPEQKAQRAAEAKRAKEEEALGRVQRRKDQALLDTYNSLQDIDTARAYAEAEVTEAIRQTEERIAIARKERQRWENEAEFYRKRTLPPDVDRGLRNAGYEIRAQTELLESKKKDLEQIRSKYTDDRRRYMEIVSRSRHIPVAPAGREAADSRPR